MPNVNHFLASTNGIVYKSRIWSESELRAGLFLEPEWMIQLGFKYFKIESAPNIGPLNRNRFDILETGQESTLNLRRGFAFGQSRLETNPRLD